MPAPLKLRGLTKTFAGQDSPVLAGIELTVAPGEILAVIGGSGCGKSTLLRLIAGLERATAGDVLIGAEPVLAPHPAIGLVFQEPRLLPWLSVAGNVGFGLAGGPRDEREARVAAALTRVGLAARAEAWPHQLSGGQAQRAALARALVARPGILLLDEPFSALDALTRADLQDHLLELWAFERPTLVLVTHDIEEALVLADRVAILRPRPGRIGELLAVELPRPRDRDHPSFEAAKRRLRAALAESPPPFARKLAS